MDGYRFPLRGLRPDEAEALLIRACPPSCTSSGLAGALTTAHRQIRVTAGVGSGALVHLDMPRWFGGQEEVPCLRELARALRLGRKLAIRYPPPDRGPRVVGPLGLVNKAGTWYLVADCVGHSEPGPEPGLGPGTSGFSRPGGCPPPGSWRSPPGDRPGFELAAFWAGWSAEFEASRPRLRGQAGRVAGRTGCLW